MSTKNVKVLCNKEGNVVSISKNKAEFGWIMLKTTVESNVRGFFSYKDRFAFRAGKVSDLLRWVRENNITGWKVDADGNETPGSVIEGKIVVKESLDQQSLYPNKEDGSAVPLSMGIKFASAYAREVNIPCMVGDQPVYRKAYYTTDVEDTDVRVEHTNIAELADLRAEEKAAKNVSNLRTAPATEVAADAVL